MKLITAAIDCDYRRTLLLIAGNRRSQYSSVGKQEVKLVSSATQTEEVDVPSEVVTPPAYQLRLRVCDAGRFAQHSPPYVHASV